MLLVCFLYYVRSKYSKANAEVCQTVWDLIKTVEEELFNSKVNLSRLSELDIRCDLLTITEVQNIISQRKLKKLQIGRSLHTGEQT